jgi:predicted nucleic acid-binding protein
VLREVVLKTEGMRIAVRRQDLKVKCLIDARRNGQLVICDVTYTELAPAFATESDVQDALLKLGVAFEAVTPSSAWKAGVSFRAYRDAGGPRERLIPDFLIAAHASVQADRLAAAERGYLRNYVADVPLLGPSR